MKRTMDLNDVNDVPDMINNALCIFNRRNKRNNVNLVNDNEKIANRTEPGYLIKLAEDIERNNDIVFHSACDKLKLIQTQMNALKQQALQILVETKISSVLHSLPCNFQKHSGHAYSVYKKPSGECYFSMISPEEWGNTMPHEYVGTFRLEGSKSWTPVDKFSNSSALRLWTHLEDKNMIIE